MREGKKLELKENFTNSFLKTVSAFANYDGGSILFGIDDSGCVTGLENPVQCCLDIENRVNDSIKPQPYPRRRILAPRAYRGIWYGHPQD